MPVYKNVLFVLFMVLFHANHLFSQRTEQERDLTYFQSLMCQAKTYHFKKVTVIATNKKKKKPWTAYEANFDSQGNITSLLDHQYKNEKHYETVVFEYDTTHRLIKYTKQQSFRKKRSTEYHLFYGNLDTLTEIKTAFYKKDEMISYNALYIGYETNPKTYITILKNKAQFTFYNGQDSVIGQSNQLADKYKDQRLWDENGCLTGYITKGDEREIQLRDEQCRYLGYRKEIRISKKWIPYEQIRLTYDNDTIVEKSIYEWNYRKRKAPKNTFMILKLTMYFTYYPNGLLESIVTKNRHGKITGYKQYVYEYYE